MKCDVIRMDDFCDYAKDYGKQIVICPVSSDFEYDNFAKALEGYRNVRFLSWPSSTDGSLTFKALTNVEYIDMRKLNVTSLPPEIGLCTKLERLDIRDNCLDYLPPELSQCLRLRYLMYSGNNLFYVSQIQALNFLRHMNQTEGCAPNFKWTAQSCNFTIMSWNIIAQSDATQSNFHKCPAKYLAWDYRMEHILHYVLQLKPALFCLQEIEEAHLNVLTERMRTIGYGCSASFGSRPRANGRHPVGIATFFMKSRLIVERTVTASFADLEGDENISKLQLLMNDAVFQVSVVRLQSQSFYLINASLRDSHFDPGALVAQLNIVAQRVDGLSGQAVICGSLGFEPGSDPWKLLRTGTACGGRFALKRRYRCCYEDRPECFTEWADDRFRTVDYVWLSPQLVPSGVLVTASRDEAAQFHHYAPNNQWPSSHMPVGATVDIKLSAQEL